MIYTRPTSRVYPLNLRERIASSGHPIPPVDPAGLGDDPGEPLLGIVTLSETDGELNRDRLNELLLTADVVLTPGEYPLAPGVRVHGHTLNLGGAHLISTERIFNGGFFTLTGVRPCLCNGRISGRYDAAPGEDGYIALEDPQTGSLLESAVKLPVGGFTEALIDGVTFDHVSGYVICPSTAACSVRHFSPAEAPADGWCRFDLTPGYPYVTARHAVGYNYEISTAPVSYRFFAANGDQIGEASGIPGEAIRVPDGALAVDVLTSGAYVRYGLFEYLHDNSLTIRGCTFRCNQRLAICNLPGVSVVEDCASVSNGYPREDHDGIRWDSSTSGFIDIEDIQTPRLTVRDCASYAENLGVASRAYSLTVEDSPQLTTRLYGGWRAVLRASGRLTFNSADAALSAIVDTDSKIDDVVILDRTDRDGEALDDLHLLPTAGATYRDCCIDCVTTGHIWYGAAPVGVFDGCRIDLDADWLLSHGTPDLVFKGCTIRLGDHYLLDQRVFTAARLTFIGCDIDRPEQIVTGPCPVEVVIR